MKPTVLLVGSPQLSRAPYFNLFPTTIRASYMEVIPSSSGLFIYAARLSIVRALSSLVSELLE